MCPAPSIRKLSRIQQSAPITLAGEGNAVVAPLRTVTREARSLSTFHPGKEGLIRLVHPTQHILAAGEVRQADPSFPTHRLQLIRLVVVINRLAAGFPGIVAFLPGGMVQRARFAQLPCEKLRRGLGWIQPGLVRQAHLFALLALEVLPHHASLTLPTAPAS